MCLTVAHVLADYVEQIMLLLLATSVVSHIIIHSEGDPLGGWSTGVEWRADVRYAAMVVKVLINSCITMKCHSASLLPRSLLNM